MEIEDEKQLELKLTTDNFECPEYDENSDALYKKIPKLKIFSVVVCHVVIMIINTLLIKYVYTISPTIKADACEGQFSDCTSVGLCNYPLNDQDLNRGIRNQVISVSITTLCLINLGFILSFLLSEKLYRLSVLISSTLTVSSTSTMVHSEVSLECCLCDWNYGSPCFFKYGRVELVLLSISIALVLLTVYNCFTPIHCLPRKIRKCFDKKPNYDSILMANLQSTRKIVRILGSSLNRFTVFPEFSELTRSDFDIYGEKQPIFISHRWATKEHPDPNGRKILYLKQHHRSILTDEYSLFIDYSCIPQKDRSMKSLLIPYINSLIRESTLIIISTPDFYTRGWCVFEVFCHTKFSNKKNTGFC